MGFERIVSVLQGVPTNYDTDLFMPIIRRTQQLLRRSPRMLNDDRSGGSYRVIADHSRAIAFLIGDGVLPANEAAATSCG